MNFFFLLDEWILKFNYFKFLLILFGHYHFLSLNGMFAF